MRVLAPFPSLRPLADLAVREEVLYDLPPLEGVFLHWHTSGVSALTPGIISLFSRRAQVLGPATLPGASIQLLATCASACLHTRPMDEYATAWEMRPLHARLLRHAPSHSAAQTQALLPPGVLAQKTVTLALGESLLLATGVGTRTLSRQELRAITQALGLPSRARIHGTFNPPPHDSVERFGMVRGMVSPFLPPTRETGLSALVLLPWPQRWDAQAREVAISLSLWESLVLPLGSLRALVRLYAGRAYPGVHIIDLGGEEEEETDASFAHDCGSSYLRADVRPREVMS
jgi:hypothetical protein